MERAMERYLPLYLRDHWAAAGGGVSLARRISAENRNTAWAAELEDLALQIAADDSTLHSIRMSLRSGSGRGGLRRRLVIITERLSSLKLNGRLLRYSPLSRVIEAEGLISGITAKQRLWLAMRESVAIELPDFDFDQLVDRAESQLTTMRAFHLWAVSRAFGVLASA
jgi:hypothetical protein